MKKVEGPGRGVGWRLLPRSGLDTRSWYRRHAGTGSRLSL